MFIRKSIIITFIILNFSIIIIYIALNYFNHQEYPNKNFFYYSDYLGNDYICEWLSKKDKLIKFEEEYGDLNVGFIFKLNTSNIKLKDYKYKNPCEIIKINKDNIKIKINKKTYIVNFVRTYKLNPSNY